MIEAKDIHLSLEMAREELSKRWNNAALKKAIETELGVHLLPNFTDKPRAVLTRQLCSPDNGFVFFYQCAKYINASPFAWEFHGDTFVHFNEEKKGLGRLRVVLEDGSKATVDIMNFHAAERKQLAEISTKTGEKLVDFHHSLFKLSGHDIEKRNNTLWFRNLGRASDYYYYLLLHFVAHGVLFVNIESPEGDDSDANFIRNVIYPAILRIENNFGIKPIFSRLYPEAESQSADEDFFWWCYPPLTNAHLVSYARSNNLPIKIIKA